MSKQYRVINAMLSVRKSTDKDSPEYEEFIDWHDGDVMTDWPKHTAIKEWLAAGHIEEVSDGKD